MADLLDGMVYAAIMASLATLRDECKQFDECVDACPFRYDGNCLLHDWPDRYDLDKIGKALQK